MRTATAFFAGVATVVVTLGAGLGGGLLIANIVSPHEAKQAADTGKLERRATETIAASNRPSEPSPYLVATQEAATKPVVVAPAPQAQPQQPEQANATQPAEALPSRETAPPTPPSVVAQPAPETAASSDDASAKARETRRSEEKRKAERRQQMAERRRVQQRQDDELRNVEQRVREQTEAPHAEQARAEMPRFSLFGNND